jgi:biotin transport system substrate-specific component
MQTTSPAELSASHSLQELRRTLAGNVFLAVSATAFVVLSTHISFPIYFTPVALTLQTMAVIVVGLALEPGEVLKIAAAASAYTTIQRWHRS